MIKKKEHVRHREWCKQDKCEFYKLFHCTHPDVPNGKIRLKFLKACPIENEECIRV
jgi:hypothetical protein